MDEGNDASLWGWHLTVQTLANLLAAMILSVNEVFQDNRTFGEALNFTKRQLKTLLNDLTRQVGFDASDAIFFGQMGRLKLTVAF